MANDGFDQQLIERYCALAPARAVAGVYGIGGGRAGDNPFLQALVERLGGRMFQPWQHWRIRKYLKRAASAGREIALYGYSRGGYAAIKVANQLDRRGVQVALLVTFDPYSFHDHGSLRLKGSNVLQACNFYQRNPRTGGRFGWWGSNPYWGSRIASVNVYPHQVNFTEAAKRGAARTSHLNIVRYGVMEMLQD